MVAPGTDFLPLEGIRVVSPEANWAGPWCNKILGDLGAEIIKIESVQRYDPTRGPLHREDWRAYARRGSGLPGIERADTFLKPNRNKRGITLNLKDPEGKKLFRRLVAMSDVVVENFATSTMDELGLGYRVLKQDRPDLIMLSMPLLGAKGSEASYLGFGTTTEALAGLTYLTGYDDDSAVRSGFYYGDPIAGIHGAAAVMLALLHRAETGEGQFIDLSQVETVVNYIGDALMHYVLRGENPRRIGNAHEAFAPHGVYPCTGEDRWVTIAVTTDAEWVALCRAMGDDALLQDERLQTTIGRLCERGRIDERVAAWTARHDAHEIERTLQAAGVPAGVVAQNRDLYEDQHLADREFFEEVTHPVAGTHRYPGAGWKMSKTSQRSRLPAPLFGQDNDYVFRGLLNLSDEEISALREAQVIGEHPLVDVWAG
jgi:crotonobetainyl-CoA:carnitine CoA-transferase CaiB-like acyl-CoA transferase